MKANISRIIKDYTQITAGALLYAMGVSLLLGPNELASGGVSGIAIIITKFTDILPTGTVIALINVPILLVGTIVFGFKFLGSTMYAVLVSSLAVNVIGKYVGALTDNLLLAAVAGSVLVGAGVGLVFRTGATTGGTDVIVKLLRLKFRHLPTGIVFGIVDGCVCMLSGLVFHNIEIIIYAVISLMLQGTIMNKVLYGSDSARMIYVISLENKAIAKRLMEEVDVGATYMQGNGAYTGREFDVLMVVLRAKQLPRARDIVKQVDDGAFMIVTNATSVFGEGFKKYDAEEV